MNEVIVYGQSDDLIEFSGDIKEEIVADIGFTEIKIGEWKISAEYNGEWEFKLLDAPRGKVWTRYKTSEYSDTPNYSQTIKIEVEDNYDIEKL